MNESIEKGLGTNSRSLRTQTLVKNFFSFVVTLDLLVATGYWWGLAGDPWQVFSQPMPSGLLTLILSVISYSLSALSILLALAYLTLTLISRLADAKK